MPKLKIKQYEYAMVYGSKNSVKDANNPRQAHFYEDDIWTLYGKKLDGLLPEGYIVYGELVGFTPGGGAIQPKYTYNAAPGEAELYIYRVAYVNDQGVLADLPWDGVREFCDQRGLKHVPELHRFERWDNEGYVDGLTADEELQDFIESEYLNTRYFDRWEEWSKWEALVEVYGHNDAVDYIDAAWTARGEDIWMPSDETLKFVDRPLPLSDPKSVDEGVCLRWDGIVPTTLKAKASKFLEHETKQLDAEVVTLEDEA